MIGMRYLNLEELGFDDWFQDKLELTQEPDYRVARVTAVDRAKYLVRNESSEVPAEVTGRLLYSAESSVDLPCVGDWVFVKYYDSNALAIIHARFPRKSILQRKAAGRQIEYQLIASNIDVALVVQSCEYDFNLRRLERYLATIKEGHVDPMILLSKIDLINYQGLDRMISKIEQAGIRDEVLAFSNTTEHGLDQIRQKLEKGKTYCLIGSSGVGKTSLINHLVGRSAFRTKAVREKDGKGRHATARRQLIVLDSGAMMIDNPGMREFGIIAPLSRTIN